MRANTHIRLCACVYTYPPMRMRVHISAYAHACTHVGVTRPALALAVWNGAMAYTVMAYVFMAYIVMAYRDGPYSYGPCSYGSYSYGPCSYGPYSHGPYSHGPP